MNTSLFFFLQAIKIILIIERKVKSQEFQSGHQSSLGFDEKSQFRYLQDLYIELDGRTDFFNISEKLIPNIFSEPLYLDIIRSAAFQRLKNIRFLGGIDYAMFPDELSKMHTRYQHSLGVARLALAYCLELELTKEEERIGVISALLHDIGHAPFSHSMESVFSELFSLNHGTASELLIRGDYGFLLSMDQAFFEKSKKHSELATSLYKIFKKYGVNNMDIVATINGYGSSSSCNSLFGFNINIDTIEGILRANSYLKNTDEAINPPAVLGALINFSKNKSKSINTVLESMKILDKFWSKKNEIYSIFINSRLGILADYICSQYMMANKENFSAFNYFDSEKDWIRIHNDLVIRLSLLRSNEADALHGFPKSKISYIAREYFVSGQVVSRTEDINSRYMNRRIMRSIEIGKMQ